MIRKVNGNLFVIWRKAAKGRCKGENKELRQDEIRDRKKDKRYSATAQWP
jgi:hypothetical protein